MCFYCTEHAHTCTLHTAGFDYVPTTIEVAFPFHDESSVTECRTVEVRDDIILEGEETFFLVLSSKSNRTRLERNRTEITILDNDGRCVCEVCVCEVCVP